MTTNAPSYSLTPDEVATWQAESTLPTGWSGDQYFTSTQGHKIRYTHAPAISAKRGTVVLTHGYGESIDQYYHVVKAYQDMGMDVWAMDWYGFGKSGRDDPAHPNLPSLKGMRNLAPDLHDFATKIVPRAYTKPLILSTHSLGGNPCLKELESKANPFDAAIMSTPMFDLRRLGLPTWTRNIFRSVFAVAAGIPFAADIHVWRYPKVDNAVEDFCELNNGRESAGLQKLFSAQTSLRRAFNLIFSNYVMGRDAAKRVDAPTVKVLNEAFKSNAFIMQRARLSQVTARVLIGSAGQDNLVDDYAHRRAAQIIPNARLEFFKTAHHGLWFENDENYNTWLKSVQTFVDQIAADFPNTAPPQRNMTPPLPQAA